MPHPTNVPSTKRRHGIRSALDASGVVGFWTHDAWADRIVVSDTLAGMLGLAPDDAAAGVPLGTFLAATLEEDRLRVESALQAIIESGGPFQIAFRTARGSRWLALRGRIERDERDQRVKGCGIAIDYTEDRAGLDQPERQPEQAVNRMAEHAIALHDLAAGLKQHRLLPLLDSLMREIGLALAGHLERAERRRSH